MAQILPFFVNFFWNYILLEVYCHVFVNCGGDNKCNNGGCAEYRTASLLIAIIFYLFYFFEALCSNINTNWEDIETTVNNVWCKEKVYIVRYSECFEWQTVKSDDPEVGQEKTCFY